MCVCVFLHDNSKRNQSRNTKLEYIVVYENENSSDEFDIELRRIKVKVTVGVQKLFPFTTIQTVRSYSSTLVSPRNLILSMNVHLILIYKIYYLNKDIYYYYYRSGKKEPVFSLFI